MSETRRRVGTASLKIRYKWTSNGPFTLRANTRVSLYADTNGRYFVPSAVRASFWAHPLIFLRHGAQSNRWRRAGANEVVATCAISAFGMLGVLDKFWGNLRLRVHDRVNCLVSEVLITTEK